MNIAIVNPREDYAFKRLQRSIDDAENRGGMNTALRKIHLESAHAQRVLAIAKNNYDHLKAMNERNEELKATIDAFKSASDLLTNAEGEVSGDIATALELLKEVATRVPNQS